MNDAVGVLGDFVLVRDQDDRAALAVQLREERHDLLAGLGVEVAGGLVGQQDRGRIDQRPGNGHALALAAGEFVGLVQHAIEQAHLPQGRALARSMRSSAGVPL